MATMMAGAQHHDPVVAAGVSAGEPRAEEDFVAYVRARQAALLRFAYLVAGDRATAEDLVQNALAKTFLSWHRIRERDALDAYVRRVIVNEGAALWRRPWKRREHPTEASPEPVGEGPDVDTREVVWALVRSLPTRQRATLVLRFYEDLSEAETAAVLGCSVGTVKSQTSRALAALHRRIERNPALLGGDG